MAFNFGSFCISRKLSVNVQNVALAKELEPTAPYVRRKCKPRAKAVDIVPGEPPPRFVFTSFSM